LEVTNWQSSFEYGLSCFVLVSSPPNGAERKSVLLRDGPDRRGPVPPEYFSAGCCTPNPAPPPRTRVGGAAPPGGRQRASRRLYSVRTPWLGGWGRLGASSWPQIRRWDRRRCCTANFWVTGRTRNPLNASVTTFCAAGVISMHQTPPGMVWGVSGVSRGRFSDY
jgi:hypothetical protein